MAQRPPLSLRVLLPHLEKMTAASLLQALKGNTAALPPGFVGEGRLESLGVSLKVSLNQLAPDIRERLLALALFESVADEDVLASFSPRAGLKFESCPGSQQCQGVNTCRC